MSKKYLRTLMKARDQIDAAIVLSQFKNDNLRFIRMKISAEIEQENANLILVKRQKDGAAVAY